MANIAVMSENTGRLYGGVAAEQRKEQRRIALIEAGLQLFGTVGYPNVSVKAVCDEAGLTQRYFYESFSDRAALLGAVYTHLVDAARAATLGAASGVLGRLEPGTTTVPAEMIPELARVATRALIDSLTLDSRRARVVLIEVVGVNPELEQLRLSAIHEWANLILAFAAGPGTVNPRHRLAALGLVGAITQLLVDWQTARDQPISPEATPELFNLDTIGEVVADIMVATYGSIFTH